MGKTLLEMAKNPASPQYSYLAFLVSLFVSKAMVKSKGIQTYLRGTEDSGNVLRVR